MKDKRASHPSPATPATKKKIDKSRLGELDSSTLVDLIKDYMGENQSLRRENGDLFSVRDMMLTEHCSGRALALTVIPRGHFACRVGLVKVIHEVSVVQQVT